MTDPAKELWLIIHGHFYQPPREDPWTDEIERQGSAAPYHDWNERITEECYAANAHARTLNLQGRIVSIRNNYEYISFNFGPTLLRWIERHDRRTYEKILEADLISRAKNDGHGNAIAQVYNHVIMPLANRRDKYTQVLWGLADFRRRFGRDAEGMWLAETAVNLATLEVLADCGVRFIVLSPTQAEAVRPIGEGDWSSVAGNSIDTSSAYVAQTRKGRIAVFFYDLEVSRSVSFEHLLTNADNFWARLATASRPNGRTRMVNIATDGEVYGHHEPFADMCLAKLVHDNLSKRTFRLTNYGCFLERCPPTVEVRLKEGNNQLGTAWSCSHGVGRWMEDCGCAIGGQSGWHQRWRTPLRAAFDLLRDRASTEARRLSEGLLRDFWAARNDSIDLLFDPGVEARDEFFRRHAVRPLDDTERSDILRALEAQKYALFMYTSCAWFFADISGIEAVQCLRYAARVLSLLHDVLPESTKEAFLSRLERAESNLPRFGNGRRIFEELVAPHAYSQEHFVNEASIARFVLGDENPPLGPEVGVTFEDGATESKEGGLLFASEARLSIRPHDSTCRYLVYGVRRPRLDLLMFVKRCDDARVRQYLDESFRDRDIDEIVSCLFDWFPRAYGLKDLRRDSKERILSELFRDTFQRMHELRSEKVDDCVDLVGHYARLGVKIPAVERANLESTLNNEIAYELHRLEGPMSHEEAPVDFGRIARLVDVAKRAGLSINSDLLALLFSSKIDEKLERYVVERTEVEFVGLMELIAFTNEVQLGYRRSEVENRMFDIVHGEVAALLERSTPPLTSSELTFIERALRLAEDLNIHVGHYRNVFDQLPEATTTAMTPSLVEGKISLRV